LSHVFVCSSANCSFSHIFILFTDHDRNCDVRLADTLGPSWTYTWKTQYHECCFCAFGS